MTQSIERECLVSEVRRESLRRWVCDRELEELCVLFELLPVLDRSAVGLLVLGMRSFHEELVVTVFCKSELGLLVLSLILCSVVEASLEYGTVGIEARSCAIVFAVAVVTPHQ